MNYDRFDVVVVGGGHAGCEAAWASAKLGCSVALCTLSTAHIATMPCNPAIGGTAKGQLVREIDALGGLMAVAIDATGLQFKVLNESRGPAVRAPRAQADKRAYAAWIARTLQETPGITIVEGHAQRLVLSSDRAAGIDMADGRTIFGASVVITTGTFLNGLIHVGDERWAAGRYGEPPAIHLGEQLRTLGFRVGRLKTGTPPRLSRQSIDFDRAVSDGTFHVEHGDTPAAPLSYLTAEPPRNRVACWRLATTTRSHDAVRANIARSPLYNGRIQGIGPRYCPSFEDKVMRFPDRDRHLLHLEPEGLESDEIYVNGLSMSLPEAVQREVVASLPGLSAATMVRPGYAVEYDFVQPTELRPTLETRRFRGLFLAGQINGTSGYEEAAGQGLVAGVNAARSVRREAPFIVGRHQGYVGVMVDDLVTRGCLEPYRLFTSRAEHRLHLRADNADLRLTPLGRSVGLVDDRRWERFQERRRRLDENRAALRRHWVAVPSGARVPAEVALRRPELNAAALAAQGVPLRAEGPGNIDLATLETEVKYGGYLRRQEAEMRRAEHAASQRIPDDFVYRGIPGLSNEVVQRLEELRPASLAHASRIPGVTPAATVLLHAVLSRRTQGS
jgi:tRNA uridine 5-carboxymethylaminomethyl modification enzyme